MLCTDLLAFFGGSGNQRSPGEMIGLSKQSSRSLMDGSNGLITED
jgi:hypothetical protein